MMIVKIQEMMQRKGIKRQGDLAKLAGLSDNSISALKQGRGRLESIGRLCRALDCQPGDLLSHEPD